MRRTLASILYGIVSLTTVVGLIYVYYASPLRDRVEDRLFDMRTRLAPTLTRHKDVATVLVQESDIAVLEQGQATDLSYPTLLRLIEQLQRSKARSIVVLLHAQVFPYEDPALEALAAMAEGDERLVIGVFNLAAGETGPYALPMPLRRIASQVGDAGVPRLFRRDVVRRMRIESPARFPMLTMRIADRLGIQIDALDIPADEDGQREMLLNYFNLDAAAQLRATDLTQKAALDAVEDRIVFLGYGAFRPWNALLLDSTHVNSPWQADGLDVGEDAMPLVTLHAIATSNLMSRSWLTETSRAANIAQTAFIVVLTLLMWRSTVGFACFLFIGTWSLILIAHALLFSLATTYIPLADSAIASMIALIAGAALKLRHEGRHRAALEAEAASKAELARVQNQFLDTFTRELGAINRRIHHLIERASPAGASTAFTTAHERMQRSCNELTDYLAGLEQLSVIDATVRKKVTLMPVEVRDVIDRLARPFEAKVDEHGLSIVTECAPDLMALADRYLLQQIAHNLVSNAVKYSPKGGQIKITAHRDGNEVVLAVNDQGPGIAPEFHDKIFEKFYRVKDDFVYKVKGHGLGLYLCRYFASQIAARIELDSTPGLGSTFRLRLKAAPA